MNEQQRRDAGYWRRVREIAQEIEETAQEFNARANKGGPQRSHYTVERSTSQEIVLRQWKRGA